MLFARAYGAVVKARIGLTVQALRNKQQQQSGTRTISKRTEAAQVRCIVGLEWAALLGSKTKLNFGRDPLVVPRIGSISIVFHAHPLFSARWSMHTRQLMCYYAMVGAGVGGMDEEGLGLADGGGVSSAAAGSMRIKVVDKRPWSTRTC